LYTIYLKIYISICLLLCFLKDNSTAFGSSNTFGAKPFGMSSGSTFGGNTNGFGTQNNTGFGFGSGMTQNQGTGNPPYAVHSEKEPNVAQISHFHSITAMPQYRNFSFEVSL